MPHSQPTELERLHTRIAALRQQMYMYLTGVASFRAKQYLAISYSERIAELEAQIKPLEVLEMVNKHSTEN